MTAFLVCVAAILFFFMMFHLEKLFNMVSLVAFILRPIFLGLILAFLLLPVHRHIFAFLKEQVWDRRNKNPKTLAFLNGTAIVLSLLFAFVIVYVLLDMVVPQVYLSVVGLLNSIPEYITNAQAWLMEFLEDNPEIQSAFMNSYNGGAAALQGWLDTEVLPNLESVGTTLTWLKETVLPNITGVVSNVSALVLQIMLLAKDILIAVIVSIYLLARKDTFAAQSKKIVYSIFSPAHGDFIVEETREAYRIMSGFINGKLLDSLIIGIITLVCCNLFRFPYPVLIAAIVGVTNIIPFFGPFIGAIPSAFLILMVNPKQSVYFIIFIVILQQFDGNILGPKILGDSTGLASFWVLFSIILSGGLFGFAGMVLGVPCFAILYSLIRRMVCHGLRKHDLPTDTSVYMGPTGSMAEISEAAGYEDPIE